MRLQLKLLENNNQISQIILQNIYDHIEPRLKIAVKNIQKDLSLLIANALRQEPEYQSLLGGQLKAELGLPNTEMVESVINALSQAIEIEARPLTIKKSGLSGGFTLNMIKSDDLIGIINMSAASITTQNGTIPWLEWLSLKGNEILVKDFVVKLGPNPNSRSGMAIMKSSTGDAWRVPPQFVGTEANNWITRAISRIENNVYSLMIKSIEAEI